MMRRILTVAALLVTMDDAGAGILNDGGWVAVNCGTQPAVPELDTANADAYNRSLKLIREWQQKAQAHNDCVVREANADNELIAKAANAEQQRFHDSVQKIGAEAAAAKAKLDGK